MAVKKTTFPVTFSKSREISELPQADKDRLFAAYSKLKQRRPGEYLQSDNWEAWINRANAAAKNPNLIARSFDLKNRFAPFVSENEWIEAIRHCSAAQASKSDLFLALVDQKYSTVSATTRKFFTDLCYTIDHNAEYRLFHLIALNEFLIDEEGTDTTFGEYLEKGDRAQSAHNHLMSMTYRNGQYTEGLFKAAAQSFAFPVVWFQNFPGTRNHLMGMTAEQYATILADPELNIRVNRSSASREIKKVLERLSHADDARKPVTRRGLEDSVVRILAAATGKVAASHARSTIEVLSTATGAMNLLLDHTETVETSARGIRPNMWVDGRQLSDTLSFLERNATEFSFDEALSLIIALAVKGSMVRSTVHTDTLNLFNQAISTQSNERAVGFARLVGHLVCSYGGARLTSAQWAGALKNPEILDLDPILSMGFLVNNTNATHGVSGARADFLISWRKAFNY